MTVATIFPKQHGRTGREPEVSVKVLTVVGARPQFVKAAPVSRELAARTGIVECLVHTGQHHDVALSAAQFTSLGLRNADQNLGINGGSAGTMVGRMVVALDEVLAEELPDVVLVYGDTNSTAAGALAAAHHDVPVAHVEAGLRSYDRTMPEERNRVMTDHLSTLLFTPTQTAVQNLAREGIRHGVHQVGDVMLDAFLASPPDERAARGMLESLGIVPGAYVIATLHRAETTATADALGSRLAFVRGVANGLPVLMPLHPRTRAAATSLSVSFDGITVVDPVDYRTFSALLSQSALILPGQRNSHAAVPVAPRPERIRRDWFHEVSRIMGQTSRDVCIENPLALHQAVASHALRLGYHHEETGNHLLRRSAVRVVSLEQFVEVGVDPKFNIRICPQFVEKR